MFPRDEIWIRNVYEPEVMSGSLTRIFKPYNRIYPNNKGFKLGEEVKVRIVDVPGNDVTNCRPLVREDYRRATIENLVVTNIEKLKPKDFKGSSKDVYDITSLRYNLGLIYGNIPEAFDVITIIDIKYI
jgi:hypothetical protein